MANKVETGGAAQVDWGVMRDKIKQDSHDSIKKVQDYIKEPLTQSANVAIEASACLTKIKVAKKVDEKAPECIAPTIKQEANQCIDTLTPHVKVSAKAGIEKCVDYSADTSMKCSDSVIDKFYDSCFDSSVEKPESTNGILEIKTHDSHLSEEEII